MELALQPMSDLESALAAVAAGDIGALEDVYRELRVPVFGVALAVLRDRALAEDVLQETFVRVFDRASSYRAGTRPAAWVLAIARNLALDTLRRERREQSHHRHPHATLEDDAVSRLAVTRALLTLDRIDRELVALHDLGGLTHAEIAATLDLPAGTVRWRYRRALARLETAFEEPDA
jgi:RNA polymerase sigma-70 factor (ECF subfamily)